MPWNYRVVKHGDGTFAIHEVKYKDGNIIAVAEQKEIPMAFSFEELRGELRRMFIDALGKPVLEFDNIPFGVWDDEDCGYDTDDELDAQDHLWSNREIYDSH